ncbi:MAG: cytochrome c oxidase assembly protein [Alsobacter sp.]
MSPAPTSHSPADRRARNVRRTLAACVGTVGVMVGLSYAAVPLYEMFCKVTGYGGTPRVAEANTTEAAARVVTVRLDANVSPALAWRFEPETPSVQAHLGETMTVFFKLTNTGRRTTTGIASFNVLPELSGGYFNKIQCFCFSDITLEPGQSIDAPVVFYVDPKIDADPDIKGAPEITLSYSFFPSKGAQRPVAEAKDGTGLPAAKPRL